jgi:hypothetical protein
VSGLEVNAKYIILSRYQNAGQSHNIEINNSSFESVEEIKYLEPALTNQNSTQEEIKSRLKSENACYHLVQNVYLAVAIQNIKIKICRTIILPVVFMGVKPGRSY